MDNLALRQYRTQEGARWKNKKEKNLLTKQIMGKGGIEYKRDFQLRSMDKERRRIQEELETIRDHGRRKGIRRDSTTGIITTSLNPPLESRNGRDRRPNGPKLTPRLQMTDSYVPFDIPPGQRPIAGKEIIPILPVAQMNRQDYVGQTVNPPPMLTNIGLQSEVNQPTRPTRFELPVTETTTELSLKEGTGQTNPLWNPDIFHRRHMVQFVEEHHLSLKKGHGTKFGSVNYYPSNSTDPDAPNWTNTEPIKFDGAKQDTNTTATTVSTTTHIIDLSIRQARENVARRLSLPANSSTLANRPELSGEAPDNRTPEGENSTEMARKSSTTSQVVINEAASRAANAETEDAYRETLAAANKPRRSSKSKADVLKSAQKFDTDMYNPDGSLRTKHMVPKFEDSYQQAQKARYIRSKERSLLDKELSVKEIFDEPERGREST